MCVEIDGTWLRKKSDYNYINVTKLDATIKGVNHVLKWDKEIEISDCS